MGNRSTSGLKIKLLASGLAALCASLPMAAQPEAEPKITLAMREAELSDVMEMLSRQNRVNILLADDVSATVSFSLYDVGLDQAIRSIASAAGYEVERRKGSYFIVTDGDAGKRPGSDFTVMRAFPIQYADPAVLENKLGDYLSSFGKVTALPERKLLMVEDQPAFLYRVATMLDQLDRKPRQVMIEARVLEVTLTDEDSYGIDWGIFFETDRGEGSVGTQGLSSPGNSAGTGLFFDYMQPDYEIALRALESDGRIRNLASPKLVTIENREAEVIIGDRRGYRVTTTINQVTTESIEFLESGVILRVTPTIDDDGRILLQIHPEVSTGTVDESGLPSQTTTEVTTELVLNSGQSIFIGGLIRTTSTEGRQGVPVLGKLPVTRWLFSSKTRTTTNVETVVMITPRLVDDEFQEYSDREAEKIDRVERELMEDADIIEDEVIDAFTFEFGSARNEPPVEPADQTDDPDIVAGLVEDSPEQDDPREETSPGPLNIAPVIVYAERRSVEPAVTAAPPSPAVASLPAPAGESPPVASEAAESPAVKDPGLIAINLHSAPEPIDPDTLPAGLDDLDRQLYLTEAVVDGVTWYRLRLGFFGEREEAEALLGGLRRMFPSSWVVRIAPREHAIAEQNPVAVGRSQPRDKAEPAAAQIAQRGD